MASKLTYVKLKKSDLSGNYKVKIDLRKLKGSSPKGCPLYVQTNK